MKHAFSRLFLGIILLFITSRSYGDRDRIIATGQQPVISTDNNGVIRIVYGQQDKIFCSTSVDKGITFSAPVIVAQVKDMHLGMSRGPQIASSAKWSVITAMDKAGDIHWFKLDHSSVEWKAMGLVNDTKGSAPEGLMSIAADNKDNFYSVWLDIRTGKHNQVYFSSLSAQPGKWTKNILAYQSPDGHVCECCKPPITVEGTRVVIMFRNWLNSSRDLYLVKSDVGKSFSTAQKLGINTWKLNGCPMDGGAIKTDRLSGIHTTWQRQGTVYFCKPGEPEVTIGKGRNCDLSGTASNTVITYQDGDNLKATSLLNNKTVNVGKGGFLKSVLLSDNRTLYVWEQANQIKYKKI